MTRLPVVDFRTMEKVLLEMGSPPGKKGATYSTGTRTEEQQCFPAILDEILPDL